METETENKNNAVVKAWVEKMAQTEQEACGDFYSLKATMPDGTVKTLFTAYFAFGDSIREEARGQFVTLAGMLLAQQMLGLEPDDEDTMSDDG